MTPAQSWMFYTFGLPLAAIVWAGALWVIAAIFGSAWEAYDDFYFKRLSNRARLAREQREAQS